MSSKSHSFEYSGRDELSVMSLAKNYNNSIFRALINSFRGLSKPKLAVDFGAGNGFFADMFLKATSCNTICIEPDEELAKEISRKNSALRVIGDLANVADGSVEFVYSLNVLEHINDDEQALNLILSKLTPGGRLYLYVPAFMILFSSNDRAVGHFRRYKINELKQKVLRAGFELEYAKYTDQVGFFAALAYKLFLDDGSGKINAKSLVFFDRWLFPLNSIFSPIFSSFFGKNIELVAQRPATRKS